MVSKTLQNLVLAQNEECQKIHSNTQASLLVLQNADFCDPKLRLGLGPLLHSITEPNCGVSQFFIAMTKYLPRISNIKEKKIILSCDF